MALHGPPPFLGTTGVVRTAFKVKAFCVTSDAKGIRFQPDHASYGQLTFDAILATCRVFRHITTDSLMAFRLPWPDGRLRTSFIVWRMDATNASRNGFNGSLERTAIKSNSVTCSSLSGVSICGKCLTVSIKH